MRAAIGSENHHPRSVTAPAMCLSYIHTPPPSSLPHLAGQRVATWLTYSPGVTKPGRDFTCCTQLANRHLLSCFRNIYSYVNSNFLFFCRQNIAIFLHYLLSSSHLPWHCSDIVLLLTLAGSQESSRKIARLNTPFRNRVCI